MGDAPLHFDTLAAQAGMRVRVGDTTSTAPPIDPSTTFTYDSVQDVHAALSPDGTGFAYTRNANPTVVTLEEVAAKLEGAEDAVAFGSGMAAIHAVLTGAGIEPGDQIVAATDLYGVSRSLLGYLATYGVQTRWVDIQDLEQVERAVSAAEARLLFFESVSNPLLRVANVRSLADIAHRHRTLVVIDNTFATPYLVRPLELGVDIVVHSATKYIAGHGDAMAGLVAATSSYARRIRDTRTVTGSVLSPFEAWLALRGIRTLPVRMERHCANALEIARWLKEQPWVQRVYYPGLPEHGQHEVARRQFGGRYGGMVAFDLHADESDTLGFIDGLRLITPGTSLGDVESLVLYPALTSHRTLLPEERRQVGIGAGLVRLSVGLESVADLTSDMEQAARVLCLARGEPARSGSG